MLVTIKVRSVGSCFACVAEIFYHGRKLAESPLTPYGMRSVAYQRAVAIAETRGWRVAS